MSTIDNYNLTQLIDLANEQKLVVPEFQRGFKWRPENIRKLLESLLLGYPVGSTLFWETDNRELNYRLIKDVNLKSIESDDFDETDEASENDEITTDERMNEQYSDRIFYILDGQQRITSIFLIFPQQVVPTMAEIDSKLKGLRFFLDLTKLGLPGYETKNNDGITIGLDQYLSVEFIEKAIRPMCYPDIRRELRDILYPVPQELTRENIIHLATKKYLYPITKDFLDNDQSVLQKILRNVEANNINRLESQGISTVESTDRAQSHNEQWSRWFTNNFQGKLIQKTIPSIILRDDRTESLPRIFETINTAGMSLTVFDLLVARLGVWRDDNNVSVSLRSLIIGDKKKELKGFVDKEMIDIFDDKKDLGGSATQSLPRILGLSGKSKSLSQTDILRNDTKEYRTLAHQCIKGLNKGLHLLYEDFGVVKSTWLPFKDAVTLCGTINVPDNVDINLLKAFYWTICFTIDLSEDTNSTIKQEYEYWEKLKNGTIAKNSLLARIENKFPSFDDIITKSSASSLIYKAIQTFIFQNSSKDWAGEIIKTTASKDLEDHHIFPSNWMDSNADRGDFSNEYDDLKNNILNRVMISKNANGLGKTGAGANNPCLYLATNGFHESEDIKKLCIPSEFCGQLITPIKKDAYKSLLAKRYELIKKTIIKQIADFIR